MTLFAVAVASSAQSPSGTLEGTVKRAVSDGIGHFVVQDLPPGQYRVQVQLEGYYASTPLTPVPAMTVGAGRPTLADVSLLAGSAISGRITDEAGKPQASMTVQAFSIRYQSGFPVLQPIGRSSTNNLDLAVLPALGR